MHDIRIDKTASSILRNPKLRAAPFLSCHPFLLPPFILPSFNISFFRFSPYSRPAFLRASLPSCFPSFQLTFPSFFLIVHLIVCLPACLLDFTLFLYWLNYVQMVSVYVASGDDEGFDLIQPSLIQQLRKILDEYPDDGQILKVDQLNCNSS